MTGVVGGGIAVQAVMSAALVRQVGVLGATLVSVSLTWVLVGLMWLAGLRSGRFAEIASVPPHLLVGGLFGAAGLVTAIVVFPKVGAGSLVAALIVGQLVAAMLLDHFGIFGSERIPVAPLRLAGAALLRLGLRLMFR